MLKAVIFDMDGVLIDSEPVHYQANKEIMEEFGYSLDYEYYKGFIGSTLTHMWETLKKKYDIKKDIKELNAMSEKYSRDVVKRDGYINIPGACELVKMFNKNGIKLAVASSSSAYIIEDVLNSLDIKEYFDAVVSGENIKNPKPAPDIFLAAAEKIGVSPEECIVIEDSANGVNGAQKAGMTAVGYINPNSGDQNLSNADYLVESFEGLEMSFFEMVYCHANNEP